MTKEQFDLNEWWVNYRWTYLDGFPEKKLRVLRRLFKIGGIVVNYRGW
jgi:hypothetical protein